MLKPANPLTPQWYTPRSERDEANPTQFLLRPLSGVEQLDIDWVKTRGGTWRLTEESGRAALMHGLLDWRNFGDATFDTLERGKNIQLLGLELTDELATHIVLRSRLTEEQIKNLLSAPTSPPTPTDSDAQVAAGGATATRETPPDSSSG